MKYISRLEHTPAIVCALPYKLTWQTNGPRMVANRKRKCGGEGIERKRKERETSGSVTNTVLLLPMAVDNCQFKWLSPSGHAGRRGRDTIAILQYTVTVKEM
jgi:hypothetical protein